MEPFQGGNDQQGQSHRASQYATRKQKSNGETKLHREWKPALSAAAATGETPGRAADR